MRAGWAGSGGGRAGHEGTWGDDGHSYCLDCGDGFTGINMSKFTNLNFKLYSLS